MAGKKSVRLLSGKIVQRHVYRRAHHAENEGFVFISERVRRTDPIYRRTTTHRRDVRCEVTRAPADVRADYVQIETLNSRSEREAAHAA